ncbi:Phosphate regulon sensor protein PhoR (SphS) [Minicystis rosea]|nr:Phosphate regulon sensor protein PhoR (SphS) [Minicystis rosea]
MVYSIGSQDLPLSIPPETPCVAPRLDLATLAAVAATMHDSICITTADLEPGPSILYVNEAFTRLTGYAPEEVVGRTSEVLRGPKTSLAVLESLKRDLREGREGRAEAIHYRRDGSEFMMSWYVVPVRDRAGRLSHFVDVQRDATEERNREVTSLLFLAAFEHTADAILILDELGRVLHANPACAAMVGAPLDELLGQEARATGLTPRRLRVYREIIAALSTDHEWHGEYEASGRRGEPRRLAVSITRVPTLEPELRFIVDARDVTHQRRLEYIADAANLVENVGYVFAGLRHELGNPINSIKTALTVLRQNLWTLPAERVEDYLDRVLQEVGRVEYLLRSMQSFNATQRQVLEPIPVGPFLTRLATIIQRDVERRGVRLVVQIDEGTGAMIADARALHQVLLNLVTNALDALTGRPAPRLRISARRRGTHVFLTIADNGPGIPPDRRVHIFKPFHTTKTKGTGLGLAITRKLVTMMRGTIELDPTSASETAFVVSLDAEIADGSMQRAPVTVRPPPLRGAP